jgi:NodT family efflux transporter outer membrane factor (OMF) lipoprotein
LTTVGCTTLGEWVRNGFKVGPNFHEPPAEVASGWIDGSDPHVVPHTCDDAWWHCFNDPVLDSLIETARLRNLDLKTAAVRVLESQAQRNVAAGNLFPQSQTALADYAHVQLGQNLFPSPAGQTFFPNTLDVWATGFNASWEIDFWGRLRRQIESSNADLGASVEAYHSAMVTLVADVATAYVEIRTFQQRITLARRNIEIQKGSLELAEARLKQGRGTSLDVEQAKSQLAQTESLIPPLLIGQRQANDRLCALLGDAPDDRVAHMEGGEIPIAPAELAVGIPADLLRRRPDVRRALHEVAAQSAQVGVAEAEFYPRLSVTGFIGYTADDIRKLFESKSFTGVLLPSVQWKILNYGRLLNNVRDQNARLEERILAYQQLVLTAGREVEDGLIQFIQYQLQARSLDEGAKAADRTVELVLAQYELGRVDFNRVFTTEAQLVVQQDQLAVAQGNIALGLIAVYRALGGGWETCEQK